MTRDRLPDRRAHEVIEFEHAGLRYVAGIGRFANGTLAEIFLSSAKAGTAADTAARDSAIVASIALQHGVDVSIIQRALTKNIAGEPSGPLGCALELIGNRDEH